ncbi:hypothetical protein L1D50_06615 [Pseudoalteromonas sp. Isolate6]|nr:MULTISPECIES: hypothetical protein [unclassified Pseudoalteromonas]MCG7553282.1 hypothetical protein [Pseudoalteromonas sp. Of11M-6]MCG9758776.1 hypothetical protein [Pseudoalteromonas sp. Isolate6]
MQFQKSTIPLSLLQKISGGRDGGAVVVPPEKEPATAKVTKTSTVNS